VRRKTSAQRVRSVEHQKAFVDALLGANRIALLERRSEPELGEFVKKAEEHLVELVGELSPSERRK